LEEQIEIAKRNRDECDSSMHEVNDDLYRFLGWADWSVEIAILQDKLRTRQADDNNRRGLSDFSESSR